MSQLAVAAGHALDNDQPGSLGAEPLPDFEDAATIGGLMHIVCRIEAEDIEAMVESLEASELMPLWGEEAQS